MVDGNPRTRNQPTIPFLFRWLEFLARLLRILLWPLRRVGQILLPAGEFDGLSPAVTEKSAQHFVSQLRTLATSPEQEAAISEAFSSMGFAALKQEALTSNSIIVVYLHSPLHRQATEMCQRMVQPSMLEFLQQDHVRTLGASIHTSQGEQLAQQLAAASFPLLAMLQHPQSSSSSSNSTSSSSSSSSSTNRNSTSSGMKLVFKAEGPALLGLQQRNLLSMLRATLSCHQTVLAEHETRRILRQQESELRAQQDAEYQEALAADQERERLQQEERDREQQRIQQEEEEKQQRVRQEEERLNRAKALVRTAPASGGTRIRFVLPSGQKLDRRFHNDETIASLKAFLILHFAENEVADDQKIKNIALSTSFPKKTYENDSESLEEGGLCPQSVLMVQDLDA